MIDSIKSRVTFAVVVVLAAIAVLVLVLSPTANKCCNSPNDIEASKRIITYAEVYNATDQTTVPVFKYAKIQDIPVNASIHFLDPFGKTMSEYQSQLASADFDPNAALTNQQKEAIIKDADSFEWYVLLRLPNALAGNQQDTSSFRAYSMLDPESKCLLGYRNDVGTGDVLMDPCHNDIFRASDGYSCFGHITVGSNVVVSAYNAIPRMKLSIDSQGYISGIKPDVQPSGDGSVGEGRSLSADAINSVSSIDTTCDKYSKFQR